MMDRRNYIERAQAYVECSNAHDLESIGPMFEAAATCNSSNVGHFATRASILEMMSGFFARFPDVSCSVAAYDPVGESSVAFDFVLTAVDQQTGESIERQGHERIDFGASGLIRPVEVSSR